MKTFNQKEKDRLVKEIHIHAEQDNIQQGEWFGGGKGCHIGCCGNIYGLPNGGANWQALSEKTGIPEWTLRLSEKIFEGLKKEDAAKFSVDFCEAIPVEVDLDLIRPQIEIARLQRLVILQEKQDYSGKDEIIKVLKHCIELWKDENTTKEQWSAVESAARSAARSAVESAARSAARSAAWSAAWSAAESAARSARSAAWSAAESARSARSAAWSAAYKCEAEALLNAMRSLSK